MQKRVAKKEAEESGQERCRREWSRKMHTRVRVAKKTQHTVADLYMCVHPEVLAL